MNAISLFSGCGGMDLGAEQAGIRVVYANDNLPEAGETYRTQFPHVEFVEGDVAKISTFPTADLVMGGYPCQSFSLGGHRSPDGDSRTLLYVEFARCIAQVQPSFFVAENVSGMGSLDEGKWLQMQLELFATLGTSGYNISHQVLRAETYGIPQRRKRLFLVGVRRDLGVFYWFPPMTHANEKNRPRLGLEPLTSHGDAVAHLPLWPTGEFYERPHDPEGHWSWYYMSRNRKAAWDTPSFTVLANFRHTSLHPAGPTMRLVWSNLADGFKQKWEFTDEYEHLEGHPERPRLELPRRLSWRECALIQTFPRSFEPAGNLMRKFEQIGNAVPPQLSRILLEPLVSGSGLRSSAPPYAFAADSSAEQLSIAF